MPVVILENDGVRVLIRPDLGAGIAACDVLLGGQWLPVMRKAPETSWFNDLACYVLAPWSNRIRDAAFNWAGKTIHIRSDWKDGTAIHGDVKSAEFVILDRSPQSVRLKTDRGTAAERNWPWKYECTVRYQLDGVRLTVQLDVTNTDTKAMPCGLGLHPFFMTRVGGTAAMIKLAASGRYPCEEMMPVAPAQDDSLCKSLRAGWHVDGGLDDVFTLRERAFDATVEWPGVLRMTATASHGSGHAVIYSGDAGREPEFFCLEPVTHVNDGFNLETNGWEGTGVQTLPPGKSMRLETVFEFFRN